MRYQWYVIFNDGFQISGQFGASSYAEARAKAYAMGQGQAASRGGIREVLVEEM